MLIGNKKKLLKYGKNFIDRNRLRIIGFGRHIEKKVIFESFGGKTYSDNPRAISEALHLIAPDVKIIWVLNEKDKYDLTPSYVSIVHKDSLAYKKEFVTSAVFVTNIAMNSTYIKRRGKQFFIQTWHGDRAFKKILYDVLPKKERLEPIMDEILTDLCVAGSQYGERKFRTAFNYNGEILLVGTPRDDCLFFYNETRKNSVIQRLKLDYNTHYLLYAPTFRKAYQTTNTDQPIQDINLKSTLKALEKKHGGYWKCLLRAHPCIKSLSGNIIDKECIINVSDYPDMTDLLLISDCLITDYSSCAGDYALLKRPIFLFQDDIALYREKDRDFYFDIKDSPYLIAHSQDELEKLIAQTSIEDIQNNCLKILSFYGTNETGHASETVARKIIEFLQKVK